MRIMGKAAGKMRKHQTAQFYLERRLILCRERCNVIRYFDGGFWKAMLQGKAVGKNFADRK
jgi:hypothetical protein